MSQSSLSCRAPGSSRQGIHVDSQTGFTFPLGTAMGVASLIGVSAKLSTAFEPAVKKRTKLAYLSKASREGLLRTGGALAP